MYNKFFRAILVLSIIIIGAFAHGQTGYRAIDEMGELRFNIEAADFRSDEAEFNQLEIYYKIFYDGLSYTQTGEGYEARYTISIAVSGNKDIQIEGLSRDGFIRVASFAETRKPTDFIINMFDFRVPNDEDLDIRAELHDKLSKTSYLVEKSLKDHDYWGKYPSISGVQFAREVRSSEKESKFNKGDLRIIPSVSRVFNTDTDSNLIYYQEIYPGRYKDKYLKFVSKVYHRAKGFVYSDTLKLGEIDSVHRSTYSIDINNLIPGFYELEIRLEGRRGKAFGKIIEEFELELTAESIFRTDYETAIEMIKYVATRAEYNALNEAKTPEERRQIWDSFWELRDQDLYSRENPNRYEYFRRIRHANRYFSIMRREGWKTNRGMIYITYGEPDEVEDFPFELSTKPYQIWHYYKSSPPRQFLFVDEWGSGDYELKPPYNGIGF